MVLKYKQRGGFWLVWSLNEMYIQSVIFTLFFASHLFSIIFNVSFLDCINVFLLLVELRVIIMTYIEELWVIIMISFNWYVLEEHQMIFENCFEIRLYVNILQHNWWITQSAIQATGIITKMCDVNKYFTNL